MATNGRRRTKGAGSIIHRKDGSWEFRREVGRDPATGKRRYVSAKGRTKAGARERFDARIAEMEAMRRTLEALAARCHGDDRPDCPILKDLESGCAHGKTTAQGG